MIPGGRLTHHSSLHSSFVFFFSFVTLFEPFQRLLVYVLGFCLDFLGMLHVWRLFFCPLIWISR